MEWVGGVPFIRSAWRLEVAVRRKTDCCSICRLMIDCCGELDNYGCCETCAIEAEDGPWQNDGVMYGADESEIFADANNKWASSGPGEEFIGRLPQAGKENGQKRKQESE